MSTNPISYALKQVQYEIPRDILSKIFISLDNINPRVPVSLDSRIREKVIEARVLSDINLWGGKEVVIPLEAMPYEMIDRFNYVYQIPKKMTGGATITRAISVGYGEGAIQANAMLGSAIYGGSQAMDAAAGVLSSQAGIPMVSTAYCHVVGDNTIHVFDSTALPGRVFLRCWVTHDDQLSHLLPTSFMAFSELVVYAVKAHIYVNAQVLMDRGFIVSGGELGRFKDIVDGYSDANENYKTFLMDKWRKISILNDQVASSRHVKILTGGLW